jgi:hypothetical protein
MKLFRIIFLLALTLFASGCSYIIDRQTSNAAEQLSATILDYDDPATVAAAIPTLLIVMDSYARSDSSSGDSQLSAARLYGAYSGAFVDDPVRRKTLTTTAFNYARSGSCKKDEKWCGLDKFDKRAFADFMLSLKKTEIDVVYAYAVAWLRYIEAHSDDWNVIADLPKPQQLFSYVMKQEETYDHAGAHIYLAALALTIPPALGGKPEVGKQHFERAIELTDGKNLVAKLEYARRYARLVFDKELHHELLTSVLASDPKQEGLTLMNVWAQQQAQILLDDESEYFD